MALPEAERQSKLKKQVLDHPHAASNTLNVYKPSVIVFPGPAEFFHLVVKAIPI